jgi:predicted HTH domain antitoxin
MAATIAAAKTAAAVVLLRKNEVALGRIVEIAGL